MLNKQNNLKRWLFGAATVAALPFLAGADIVPTSMVFEEAYTADCVLSPEIEATSPNRYKPAVCNGEFSVAVFRRSDGEKVLLDIPLAKYTDMGEVNGVDLNPTYTEYKSILDVLTPKAEAAIAYDNSNSTQAGDPCSSKTWAFQPVSTDNNILVVGAYSGGFATDSVTYDGNALTEIDDYVIYNAETQSLWYKTGVGNSSANVVVTWGGSTTCRSQAISFTGVKQTDPIAQTNHSSIIGGSGVPTYLSLTVTPTDTTSWIVSNNMNNIGNLIAGPNITLRGTANSRQMGDSNTTATSTWIYQIAHGVTGGDGNLTSLWAEICEVSGCGGGSTPLFSTEFIIFE